MAETNIPLHTLSIDDRSTADAYLEALSDHGIDYVFANAGTDFAPIVEALIKAQETGTLVPEFVAIPHENVAVSMGHGYSRISGKPAAVMVHTTVGTANALCALINASRDNIPLFLAAGRTPYTELGHAGSRGANIHWGQEVFDQGGMVRDVVKWDYELRSGQPAETVVNRALEIAMSAPKGPVYLTLPREVLSNEAATGGTAVPNRNLGSSAPAPEMNAISEAADAILASDFPVLVTTSGGRVSQAFKAIGEFAEKCGVAVVQPFNTDVNLPSAHPMNFGGAWKMLLELADMILVLDSAVPWNSKVSLNEDSKVIQIAPDPFYRQYPLRGFPADIAITGSATTVLPLLTSTVTAAKSKLSKTLGTRLKKLRALQEQRAVKRNEILIKAKTTQPISGPWIAECINQVKSKNDIVVNELGSPFDIYEFSEPATYMAVSSAGGLGFGLGASLGAKLAAPDKNVFTTLGDGSYFFGVPTSAHFVARSLELPTVTVISNNGRWNAVHNSALGMYPAGRIAKSNNVPLVHLDPSPAFEKLMAAFDGYGEKVSDPATLPGALERALKATQDGDPAVLNVEVENNTRPPI